MHSAAAQTCRGWRGCSGLRMAPARLCRPAGMPAACMLPDEHALTPRPAHLACSDRPACENVEGGGRPQDAHYPLIGALVHCNLRLGPVALQRLGHFVDQAMRRWAARTGRYEVLQQGPPAALEAAGANEPAPQAWHATPPAAPRRGAGRRRHSGTGSTPGGAVEQAARRW